MLLLDTNHLSELGFGSPRGLRLRDRLVQSREDLATSIINVEEQLRGWLAEIHSFNDPVRQVPAYQRLQHQLEFISHWKVLPWTIEAAHLFHQFRRNGVRIGSMDLKIACISLVHGATLLTRNINDFSKLTELKVANWLD